MVWTPSLETASSIAGWANIALIASLVGGVIATVLIVWMGNVKEAYWDAARDASAERIAALSTQATEARAEIARSNAEVAKANENTATLQKEAEEARAEQQRLKQQIAWRRISKQQHDALVSALKGKKIDFFLSFVDADPESALFRDDIDRTMKDAGLAPKFFSGWQRAVGLSIAGDDGPDLATLMEAFAAAGLPLIRKPIDHKSFKIELLVGSRPPVF